MDYMKILSVSSFLCVVFLMSVITFSFYSNYNKIMFNGVANSLNDEIKNSSVIVELGKNISEKCSTEEKETCYFSEISNISNNLTYRGRSYLQDLLHENLNADYIFYNGSDCKGKAIFNAQLLRTMGFEVYYLMQENHVCVTAKVKDDFKNINCLNETILSIEEVKP